MDIAFILGVLIGIGALVAMVFLEGGSLSSLILIPPIILVWGATIGLGIASGTLGDAILAAKSVPRVFMGKSPKPGKTIEKLVEIADKARKGGMLSLEKDASETKDPFMKNALQNIADGTDGEELRTLLEDQLESTVKQDAKTVKWFKVLGGFAPTIGVLGTVVSLTHVLENLSNPEELGHMIAAAFIATFWGLASANFFWLPISDRLARLAALEMQNRQLIIEGALAIQSGIQPRLLGERLEAMIPPSELGKKAAKGGGKKGKGDE